MRINRRQSQSCSSTSFEGWNNKGVIGGIFFQLARTEQSRASIIRIPSKKVLELLLDATNLIRIRCAQQIVADHVAADVHMRPRPCFVVGRKQLSGLNVCFDLECWKWTNQAFLIKLLFSQNHQEDPRTQLIVFTGSSCRREAPGKVFLVEFDVRKVVGFE